MDADRWQRVAELYDLVLEREPSERGAFLDAQASGDKDLRREVQSLLAQDSEKLLIDEPMLETAAEVLDEFDFKPGSQLGPYRIDSIIGAGGMGHVYRATDTRLNRTVALKVLPQAVARDAQFRARFAREAHAIAALNHPHVCTLYDIGQDEHVDFLVMEYLEGDTLATRLGKGSLPLDTALSLAVDVAEALAAAHRGGIVHRDVKPGNIVLTNGGAKLVDFGLVKPTVSVLPPGGAEGATTPPSLTTQGALLGTIQYMAPEQLEGREPDARTDIFAFGAVLYEMLTGKKAFEGKSQASLIGAIMYAERSEISASRPLTPPALDRLVKTCLAKEPDDRWQTAHDLARELRWIRHHPAVPTVLTPRNREWIAWLAAIGLGVAATITGVIHFGESPPRPLPVRFAVSAPPDALLRAPFSPQISPDGTLLVFMSVRDGEQVLVLRRLDALDSRVLSGTEDGAFPFWSPDSRAIAFFANGQLKKVRVSGGSVQTICKTGTALGGTWNREDVILFASSTDGVLYRVSASGGQSTPLISLEAGKKLQGRPQFLPDGRRFLYFVDPDGVYLGSLDGGPPTRVPVNTHVALYSPPGYLLFPQGRTLVARRFSSDLSEPLGDAVPLADDVVTGPPVGSAALRGGSAFSVSENGVLAYAIQGSPSVDVASFERSGRPLGTIGPFPFDAAVNGIELSPDGTQFATQSPPGPDPNSEIWLFNLLDRRSTQLTFTPGADRHPVWSPDGRRLVFASRRVDAPGLYQKPAGGQQAEELLLRSPSHEWDQHWPTDWSSRGIVYESGRDVAHVELWMLPVDGDRKPYPLVREAGNHHGAKVSPDGKWLAYQTTFQSGLPEIVIQSLTTADVKIRVSTEGGTSPRWRSDGSELFYLARDGRLMAVTLERDDRTELRLGATQPLFQTGLRLLPGVVPAINVSPDGQRFFTPSADRATAPSIVVLANWVSTLRR
jgi:eukaryotic-like serine/threonine-protein kinase